MHYDVSNLLTGRCGKCFRRSYDPSLRYRRYVFKDRIHAGERLAQEFRRYKTEVVFIIAIELHKSFDLIIIRKILFIWSMKQVLKR